MRGAAASALVLALPLAAAAQAPIGLFQETQVETQVALDAWPDACGKLPVASRVPGRGPVSLDVRGGVLIVRAKKPPVVLRSDACVDPALVRGASARDGNTWSQACRGEGRSERTVYAFAPPDDVVVTTETVHEGACRGRVKVIRSFRRAVPTPVPQVAAADVADAGVAEELPDAGVAEDAGVAAPAEAPRPRAVAKAEEPEPEPLPLPDVELEDLDDEEGYFLPVGELGKKKHRGLLLAMAGGVAVLVAAAAAALVVRRRARPQARPEAPKPPGTEAPKPKAPQPPPAEASKPPPEKPFTRQQTGRARFCPSCGKPLPDGARFCPACRTKIPAP